MQELFVELVEDYTWVLGVLALVGIEVMPIKFSPIKMVGQIISNWLGISAISKDVDNLRKEVNNNEIDRIKYEILQFSGSLRNGLKRTEVDYQHIEMIFTKYKNKGGNSYIMHEMEYIRDCHDKGMIL
jgi:hypothetical protein